ncbi:MAG: relaxase/mobilization nuclease domain-containing protein [Bacteroidetes bacterium]|nr:relaxase/mobilization nuclease domain-containing protein [Bacteroidota bacterium]
MIGKMKSNISLKDTIEYNIKEHSEIVSINNVFGDNWKEIEMQMLTRQKLYEGRAQNLTAHIFLSPSIADGKKLTLLDWKEIAQSFLEKARLTGHQSIAFLHQDKEHSHLHIVVNRIDENGCLYRHKNELALSQRLGDEIAKERGMIRAAEIMRERQLAKRAGIKISDAQGSIEKIRRDLHDSAKQSFNGEKVFVPGKYFKNLEAKGYKVKVYFKRPVEGILTTEVSGYSIGRKGERLIRASTLGREFSLERLANVANQNWKQQTSEMRLLKTKVEEILNKSFLESLESRKSFDPQKYFEAIRSHGCPVKEYFSKDTGSVRGYGIEIGKMVFNSSEIGADFTLTYLKKRTAELVAQNGRTQIAKEVPENPVKKYFPELNGTLDKGKVEKASKELTRAIDLVKIEMDLKELTSGHRYKHYIDFIKAIEERGYHIHLRYDLGKLSGYTIHKGIEHYHDWEIDKGQFQLSKLIKGGMFRNFQTEITTEIFEKNTPAVNGTSLENIPEVTSSTVTEIKNTPEADNFLHIIRQSEKREGLERARIRQKIAKELATLMRDFIKKGQTFSIENYFSRLKAEGFDVIKHNNKESGLLRGYSLAKYGFSFHASEVGKVFTLKSIGEIHMQSPK